VIDPDGITVRISETKYNALCGRCAPPPAGAIGPVKGTPLLRASTLNHVNFRVSNLQRSAAFYQRLFGLPPTLRPLLPPGSHVYGLDFNECYLSLGLAPDRVGTVDHFCFGIDNFDLRDAEKLRGAGLAVRGLTGGYPTVYVNDPDGLSVQIADSTWKSECPACDPAPVA